MKYKTQDEEERPYNVEDSAENPKGSGRQEEDSSVQPPPGLSSFPSPYLGLPSNTGSPSGSGELNSDIMDKEQGKEMIDLMILKLQKMNSFLEGVVTYWDEWAARGGEKTTADEEGHETNDEKYLEKTEVESEKRSSSEYNEPSDKKDGKDDDEGMPYKKEDEDEEKPYKNEDEGKPYKNEDKPYKNEDEEKPYKNEDKPYK